jgi:hypothetical protein
MKRKEKGEKRKDSSMPMSRMKDKIKDKGMRKKDRMK